MAEVKWIKIVTDIFDDEKILLIESMPDGDSIIVIWFKLLCMAGKQNNGGVFQLNDRIAYTDEMLATVFRRPLNTVRLAIQTFEKFGMIEIVNNTITIPSWGKHQSIEKLEARRDYMRDYMKGYREKQQQIACSHETGSKCLRKQCVSSLDIEEDKEEDKEKEEDKRTASVDEVVKKFNETCVDLPKVQRVTDARRKAVKARIKDVGLDTVLSVIEAANESDFLSGRVSDWRATFDWIMKPANFAKILEGNYANRKRKQPEAGGEYDISFLTG